jgi:hypothetical protein
MLDMSGALSQTAHLPTAESCREGTTTRLLTFSHQGGQY